MSRKLGIQMVRLTQEERELLFQMAEGLTGANHQGDFRREIIPENVAKRMELVGISKLPHYLKKVESSRDEHAHFLSALTIHTTSWFRELPHFKILMRHFDTQWTSMRFSLDQPFKVWCAACSTGEEVYSVSLLLDSFRRKRPGFDYRILGSDIDPVSIDTARRAIYPLNAATENQFPIDFQGERWLGEGRAAGYFTLSKEIRERTRFEAHDLLHPPESIRDYHLIICRNVLIYFSPDSVRRITETLAKRLVPGGLLMLGHSESIPVGNLPLKLLTNAIYERGKRDGWSPGTGNQAGLTSTEMGADSAGKLTSDKRRVLIIDDSQTIRTLLSDLLTSTGFETVAVESADYASQYLENHEVDLITLDLHMPGTDGMTWLKRVRESGLKTPITVLSDTNASEAGIVLSALENGAQDYIEKKALRLDQDHIIKKFLEILGSSERRALFPAASPRRRMLSKIPNLHPEVILLGASTGGTEALTRLLKRMPLETPPILVVQHISPEFAKPFAERLAQISGLKLGPPDEGAPLKNGHIYLSWGDSHIGVRRNGRALVLTRSNAGPVTGHRPSVDFLFKSAALANARAAAALLTGMGGDGALGLLELKNKGNFTLAQDEETSVVYGMPKEAARIGAAEVIGDLQTLRSYLDQMAKANSVPKSESVV